MADSPGLRNRDHKNSDNRDLLIELIGKQQTMTHYKVMERSPRKKLEKKVVISKNKVLNAGFKGLRDHIR